ncbi:hypothetical protein C8Q80DRAFT_1268027 [Daedaleopsis nitida]|nr:hypothetical protein C8Q80DRAFT_1268027 [Daedaleopsis nitida]
MHNHNHQVTTIHDLATELLENIFALACTDGGYTGCSLSLVSKDIRVTSRPTRFFSISLVSETAQPLAKFLRCFDAECAATRAHDGGRTPLIRHLCIAAAEGEDKKQSWRYDTQADAACEAAVNKEQARYRANVVSLLQRVAPSLHTLSLVHWQGWQNLTMLPDIECAGFPLLQELTLVGPDPFIPAQGCTHPLYPRLARLHLVDNWGSFEDLPRWLGGGRAPRITHLRLTNLAQIPAELKALVESAERDKLPDLVQFVIQPKGPPAPGARCGNPYLRYAKFQGRFQELLAGAAFPIEVFPHHGSRYVYADSSTRRQWLDRLEGGPGCWALDSGLDTANTGAADSD